MNRGLLSALLAAIGAILGYLLFKPRHLAVRVATVRIQRNPDTNRFSSHTNPQRLPVKVGDKVRWNIVPRGVLPEDASVVLRFESSEGARPKTFRGSPLSRRKPRDEREDGDRVIKDRVQDLPYDIYPYEVWYESPQETYMMEDPEIQIEF